jgi:transcriptional antiterminator RfaH
MNSKLFETNRWYLISTKSRSEVIAYENLNNQGHEIFLPTIKLASKSKVLFPGYIFVKPKIGSSYISIKSTKGVKNFIKFDRTFPIVSETLIKFLKSRMKHFEKKAKDQKKYQKGDLVNIETGPFKDINAVFDSYDKNQNVFILLRFLERSQKIRLKESYLN